MVKYGLPVLTVLLFLVGLLLLSAEIFYSGINANLLVLEVSTAIGFLMWFSQREKGALLLLFVSGAWLLRYFIYLAFFVIYPEEFSPGRLLLVGIPLILALGILLLSYKWLRNTQGHIFELKLPVLVVSVLAALALLSYGYKTYTPGALNCWCYLNGQAKVYQLSIFTGPGKGITVQTERKDLREFVQKYGMVNFAGNRGTYCPETKVEVVRCFRKTIAVRFAGFRNTTIGYEAIPASAFKLELDSIKGDWSILEPEFQEI